MGGGIEYGSSRTSDTQIGGHIEVRSSGRASKTCSAIEERISSRAVHRVRWGRGCPNGAVGGIGVDGIVVRTGVGGGIVETSCAGCAL